MKILDYIATAAAIGVFGYFMYKVIVPKLADLKLPVWQPPQQFQAPPPQQPAAPQIQIQPPPPTPSSSSSPPAASTDEDDEPVSKPKPQTQTPKSVVPSRSPPSAVASPPPPSPAGPAPASGTLLWDSNTHGKWNSGKRVVTEGDGGQGPNGKGLHTAASGNPTLTIDGNGIAHLTSSRWGRIYIYANNYNSRLEGNFMFETDHGEADNISIKMRSRHSHSGHTTAGGSNEFGGVGFAFHPSGQVELAAEIEHQGASYDFGNLQGPPLQLGKWHKFAISVYDGGGINVKVDVDGKTIGTKKWTNPHATAIDKAAFNADSYFWIRLNCHDGKNAKAGFSNLKLYDLGASAGFATANIRRLMIDEPYLFNGYLYGRRQ